MEGYLLGWNGKDGCPGSRGEVQIKMKLLVIPKTLSVAENMLRVVKNCNVSMAEFDKQFELIKRLTPEQTLCSLPSQSHFEIKKQNADLSKLG